jgi:selT/selW/selH-like putative selenoprotein
VNGLGGHEATVTPGGRGQFDVLVDGDLVFSKQSQGRFPEHEEILTRL